MTSMSTADDDDVDDDDDNDDENKLLFGTAANDSQKCDQIRQNFAFWASFWRDIYRRK